MALKKLDWSDYDVSDDSIDIRGWSLVDQAGAAVGKIADLLFDPADNEVRYALADLDGGRRVMVPIGQIALDESDRRATATGYTRDRLTALRAYEDNDIDETSEREVYREHNPGWNDTDKLDYSSERYRGEMPNRIQLLEERLRVGKRREQVGEVTLGKKVITEDVAEDITLKNERLEINRIPVDKPAEGTATIGGQETIKVSLYGEEPVVAKQAFVKEEIEVNKVADTRTERVTDKVMHEELVTDGLNKAREQEFVSAEPTEFERRQRRTTDEKIDIAPLDEGTPGFDRPL